MLNWTTVFGYAREFVEALGLPTVVILVVMFALHYGLTPYAADQTVHGRVETIKLQLEAHQRLQEEAHLRLIKTQSETLERLIEALKAICFNTAHSGDPKAFERCGRL